MQKKTLTAGIIGSGYAADFHFEALRRIYSVNLETAGVYSPNPEHCRKFAAERGLKAWDSAGALMDAVDSVHLCTPPDSHESLAVEALKRNRNVIIEKPFTGYFGTGTEGFNGDTFPRKEGREGARRSIENILNAEAGSRGRIFYAENWIYAPAVQKEREILEKTKGQILWIHGEESHSGSHSRFYGIWSFSGGGSVIGKGVHPLSAALYLKAVEGKVRFGKPIRPAAVSARTHALTRRPEFKDDGFLRTSYTDIEDFGALHVVFDDGTIADIFASELTLGGKHSRLEVNAGNHRAVLNINPNNAMQTYNPREEQFSDIYVVEKIGTKQGWASTSPDENWFTGYDHEMESFYSNMASDTPPESDSLLAADTIMTVYSGYVSAENQGKEEPVVQL